MNERIKELALQAGVQEDLVDHLKDEVEVLTYIARPQDIQKFAELIVKECMRVADSSGKGWAHLNGTPGNRIRQHFGVQG
jgi:hypothetical protein